MTLLDEIMPTYDRREVHRHSVAAPPAAVWAAVRDLSGDELKLMRLLMGMRTLGRRSEDSSRTVLEGFERMGFRVVAERARLRARDRRHRPLLEAVRRPASGQGPRALHRLRRAGLRQGRVQLPARRRQALDRDADRRNRRPRPPALRPLLAPGPPRQRPDQARVAARDRQAGRVGLAAIIGRSALDLGDRSRSIARTCLSGGRLYPGALDGLEV